MPRGGGLWQGTIANGGTQMTVPADLNGWKTCSILLPTLDSGTVALQGSLDGTNFYPLKDQTPTQQGLWATNTGGFFLDADIIAKFHGIRYLQVVCSATQSAARTISFYLSRE